MSNSSFSWVSLICVIESLLSGEAGGLSLLGGRWRTVPHRRISHPAHKAASKLNFSIIKGEKKKKKGFLETAGFGFKIKYFFQDVRQTKKK